MANTRGMRCWECGGPTFSLATREQNDGTLRRYRRCRTNPNHRFATVELTVSELKQLQGAHRGQKLQA